MNYHIMLLYNKVLNGPRLSSFFPCIFVSYFGKVASVIESRCLFFCAFTFGSILLQILFIASVTFFHRVIG